MDVGRIRALLPLRAPVAPPSALPESAHDDLGTTPAPEDASRFFLLLAEALHVFGMGAHNLERVLYRVAKALGIEGEFLVTPTFVVLTLGPAEEARTHMVRVSSQELDLARLTELHRLVRSIAEGSLTASEASRRLRELRVPRALWSPVRWSLAQAASAAGAAAILQGGWAEIATAAGLGTLLGLFLSASERTTSLRSIEPLVAGLMAAAAVGLVSAAVHPVVSYIPTMAAIVTLLPGLSLTIAINEVAHGHTVAGSSRLTGVMMTLLQLGLGVAVGQRLAVGLVGTAPSVEPATVGPAILTAAAALVVVTFALRSRARRQDLPVLLFTAGIGLAASKAGTQYLGTELGVCAAAWLVGTIGNGVSRLGNIPAATTILPALLLLVPGSLGFSSVSSLIAEDVVVGLQGALSMVLIAFSLVTGLLLASLTTRPADLF